LLPPGLLARDLTITALASAVNLIHMNQEVNILGDSISIEGDTKNLQQVLRETFDVAQKSIKRKEALPHIKSHKNDRQVMSKVMKVIRLNCEVDTYLGYAQRMCEWALKDIKYNITDWQKSLFAQSVTRSKIELGKETFSALQPFKIEKYEYGKGFIDLKVQLDLKVDKRWMALLLAGFAIAYSGYSSSEILLSPIPEQILAKASRDLGYVNYLCSLTASQRILEAFHRLQQIPENLKLPPDPPHAYNLLLAIELSKIAQKSGMTVTEAPPYMFYRILFTGKSFSLIERIMMDVSPILSFTSKLRTKALEEVEKLLQCTVRQSRIKDNYCFNRYGDIGVCNKVTRLLYEASIGSRKAEDVMYQLARSLPEGSPLKREDILTAIYNALF